MKKLIVITTVALGLLLALVVLLASQQLSAALPAEADPAEIRVRHQPTVHPDADLRPRVPSPKPAHTTTDPDHYAGYVVLKFQEGTQVRLRDGRLTSLVGADLAVVEAVLASYPDVQPLRLFQRSEATLDQERLRGQRLSGWQLADLNLYYALPVAEADRAARLCDSLNGLDIVEIAYPEPLAEPAGLPGSPRRGDIGLPTPSFVANQGYLSPTVPNNGIDAIYAWTLPGGTGVGVKFIDLEYSWQTTHEDLLGATRFYSGGQWYDDAWFSFSSHGTAVLGEIVADSDITGVTGIAYDAQYGLEGTWLATWPDVANAINAAAAQLSAGDIILIELHCPTTPPPPGEQCDPNCGNCTQFGYIAIEHWQANFDAIQNATANGRIVVEAAGNGAMNLDNPFYGGTFDRNQRDSGAIIVGAGLSGVGINTPARKPDCWSNYGSAVDVQGWGDSIWTLGYGDGWNEGWVGGNMWDRDQWYTNSFGGTSGASPMAVGAAASINGMRKAAGLPVLTPLHMRRLLRNTGTPQARDHKPIGPLPNLRSASAGLFHTVVFDDAWGNGTGVPEPGERGLLLDIGLEALGIMTYTNVSATLSSTVSGLTILTPTNTYPTLTPIGGPAVRSFAFDLADSITCGISLPFTLSVTTNQGPYTATLRLQTGVLAASGTTFTSSDVPHPIPDGLGAVTSYLTITQSIPIGDLDAKVSITHPHVWHLRGKLFSPSGHSIWLMNRVGGGAFNNNDFAGTIFDDEAVASIRNAAFPATGRYRPEGFLSDFDGQTITGTWRLVVDDQSPPYTGTLNGWSLTVRPHVCPSRISPTATKSGPDLIGPGHLLSYTLVITNPGGLPLYNVVVTETYDANTTFLWADPPPTSGNNVWHFDRLGNDSTQLIITVQVAAAVPDYTVMTNTAQIDADDVSPITVVKTTTVLRPQFSIAKQADPDPAQSFHPFTYTLTVGNGGGPATGVVITDALPAGVSYVGCGGGTCSESGGVVTWSGLTVPHGGTVDVTFVVTACTGPLVNSAYRVASCAEGVSSPWGTLRTTTVQAPTLTADFTPTSSTITEGQSISFSDVSVTDGGPIVAWEWNFGNGETGSGQIISHTYTAAGTYTVTLTVTDTCGYTDTKRISDAVRVHSRVYLPLVLR